MAGVKRIALKSYHQARIKHECRLRKASGLAAKLQATGSEASSPVESPKPQVLDEKPKWNPAGKQFPYQRLDDSPSVADPIDKIGEDPAAVKLLKEHNIDITKSKYPLSWLSMGKVSKAIE